MRKTTTLAAQSAPADAEAPEDDVARARAVVAAVVDPEIPVLTLADLGILRGVERRNGELVVELTPTYTGCPATLAIRLAVGSGPGGRRDGRCPRAERAVAALVDGLDHRGRTAQAAGIRHRPAGGGGSSKALFADPSVACPRCGSTDTTKISEFGSTACKAQWRCAACAEPFDYFKCI